VVSSVRGGRRTGRLSGVPKYLGLGSASPAGGETTSSAITVSPLTKSESESESASVSEHDRCWP